MYNRDLYPDWEVYINGVVYAVRGEKESAVGLANRKATKNNKIDIVCVKNNSSITTDSWINGKRNRLA